MTFATFLPSSGLTINAIHSEYKITGWDLTGPKDLSALRGTFRAWTINSGIWTYTTPGSAASSVAMSSFRTSVRQPFAFITSGSRTLTSSDLIGQPSGWNTGHTIYGYCNYGNDTIGNSIRFGSATGIRWTNVNGITYQITQALFNPTTDQYMLRVIQEPDTSYPQSNTIQGMYGFPGFSGTTFGTFGAPPTTYTEDFLSSNPRMRVYVWNGISDDAIWSVNHRLSYIINADQN